MTEHECGEVGLALMEDAAVERPKMVGLKEQLFRNKQRHMAKIMTRRMKHGMPAKETGMVLPGNKDHGCPFKGRDVFSGQNRAFADRIERNASKDKFGRDIDRLHYADNNKYNGDGTLKD